jgi:uracil-DNA glycosylase
MKNWEALLGQETNKAYFSDLLAFVEARREDGIKVFPPEHQVFNAFGLTSPEDLKIVILGQDPYHGEGQAHGLSFSVQQGTKIPPSLRNIYKELVTDVTGFTTPEYGDLSSWAKQGVLLLNTVLTVEEGQAHSHKGKGWEVFTDAVIAQISDRLHNVIFILWGNPAQKKSQLIDADKHYILNAVHPSPLSAHRGFFGCQHFSQSNQILRRLGKAEINWQV